jgi:hypothetical protein
MKSSILEALAILCFFFLIGLGVAKDEDVNMISYRGQVVEKWSEDVEGFTIYRIRILEPLGTERIWNSRNFHEKVEVNEWYEFESNKTMLYKPKKIKPIKPIKVTQI